MALQHYVKYKDFLNSSDTFCPGNIQARDHIDSKITAARRVFYGLQGAGLCARGTNPFSIAHIYKTAIQPILTYGCSNLNLTHNDINELEKVQASLIKTALGLPKYSRNTPIQRALHINPANNS